MIQVSLAQAPLRVLIADDNRDFAANLSELARLHRLETSTVQTVADALEALRRETYDVAVIDNRLPDGMGTDFLEAARSAYPDLVTVLVTAFASQETTVRALNAGAFAFVTKDSEPEAFLDALHRAAETALLRRENRRLRTIQEGILAAVPDQLLLVDAHAAVVSANRTDPLFFRADSSARLPAPIEEVLSPQVRDRLPWRARIAEAQGGSTVEPSLTIRTADAATKTFAVRFTRVAAAPHGLTLIRISDISEKLELDRRLGESVGLATLGRLVAVIAHELRNPITGIRALSQLLRKNTPPGHPDSENVDEILVLTDRMSATLADLLTYARPLEWKEEHVSLAQLAEDVVRAARRWPASEGRTVKFESEVPDDPGVRGQRDRLFSALSNLVENALHATPEGGKVIVRLIGSGSDRKLAVEDSGKGIVDTDRAKLFEPFFTRKPGGTGLGLAIVKLVMDSHGGTIEVGRSERLGGAAFIVSLPLAPARVGSG